MDPSSHNIEQLLAENLRIASENAEELKRIRKELMWMSILRIVVWLILAGVPVFVYLHLVKPPLQNIFGLS
ncbi:MAG TPA: hypothetical protein VEB18_01790 [Candidatus Paceibacterota bacterium]|nr:hypothetical protein [Candidatus Paceibacterota bacterium]